MTRVVRTPGVSIFGVAAVLATTASAAPDSSVTQGSALTDDGDSDEVEGTFALTTDELRAYLPGPVAIPCEVLRSLATERVLTLKSPGHETRLRMFAPRAWAPTSDGFTIPGFEGRAPGALTFEAMWGRDAGSKAELHENGRRLIATAADEPGASVEQADIPEGHVLIIRRPPPADSTVPASQPTTIVAFRVLPNGAGLVVLRATVPADPFAFYEPHVRRLAQTFEVLP